jgi:hypothetical protein
LRKVSFLALIFFIVCGLWYPYAYVAGNGVAIRMVYAEDGSFLVNKEMPRIMVLIAEQNVGKDYSGYRWGTICDDVIRARFTDKGFTFADYSIPEDEFDFEKFYQFGDLSDESAVSLGNQGGAELVITGKALVKCMGNVAGTTMKSFQSTLTAKALRVNDGVVVASASVREATIHMDDLTGGSEAIEKAATKLANLLESQIIAKWQKEVGSTAVIAMTVRGMKSCSDFVQFIEVLKTEVRGIKNVCPRRIESDAVKLDLNIRGSAQSLADELFARKFIGFSLDITNISQENIELRLYR